MTMARTGTSFVAQQAANWLGVTPGASPTQLGAVAVDPVVAQEQYLQTRMQQTESMEAVKRPSNALVLLGSAVLTYVCLVSKGRTATTRK